MRRQSSKAHRLRSPRVKTKGLFHKGKLRYKYLYFKKKKNMKEYPNKTCSTSNGNGDIAPERWLETKGVNHWSKAYDQATNLHCVEHAINGLDGVEWLDGCAEMCRRVHVHAAFLGGLEPNKIHKHGYESNKIHKHGYETNNNCVNTGIAKLSCEKGSHKRDRKLHKQKLQKYVNVSRLGHSHVIRTNSRSCCRFWYHQNRSSRWGVLPSNRCVEAWSAWSAAAACGSCLDSTQSRGCIGNQDSNK